MKKSQIKQMVREEIYNTLGEAYQIVDKEYNQERKVFDDNMKQLIKKVKEIDKKHFSNPSRDYGTVLFVINYAFGELFRELKQKRMQ